MSFDYQDRLGRNNRAKLAKHPLTQGMGASIGGDAPQQSAAGSPQECMGKCATTSWCWAYSYLGADQLCYMHRNDSRHETKQAGWVSGAC